MNIQRTGLKNNNRGLKNNDILSQKRGLKHIELTQITKIIYEIINEDENSIVFDENLKEFSFSVNTKNKLNKVYNKFHNLYGDINRFNDHFKNLHWSKGEKLDNNDILNDVRDKMYFSRNDILKRSEKRPERIQYKKQINESILK